VRLGCSKGQEASIGLGVLRREAKPQEWVGSIEPVVGRLIFGLVQKLAGLCRPSGRCGTSLEPGRAEGLRGRSWPGRAPCRFTSVKRYERLNAAKHIIIDPYQHSDLLILGGLAMPK
jgi:hypothetical protein